MYTIFPTHLNFSILSSRYLLFIENLQKRQSNKKREDAPQLLMVELRQFMIDLLVLLLCAVYFLSNYYEQKSRINFQTNFQNSGWQFEAVIEVDNFVADCMDMFFDDSFGFCLSFQHCWKVAA